MITENTTYENVAEENKKSENTEFQQTNVPENSENENTENKNKEALPDFIEKSSTKNVVEAEIIEKTTHKTEKKPKNEENTSTRLTITTSFVQNEVEHLKHIIAARIEAGATRDNSHFIRQCVDFTINSGFVFKEKRFGLPENTPKLILKDAFFNNNK